jgi:hypothetical protein
LHVRVAGRSAGAEEELVSVNMSYADLTGELFSTEPFKLSVSFVEQEYPVEGFSSPMVLRSGMMMRFAQALRSIGELYYATQEKLDVVNQMRNELWDKRAEDSEVEYEEITSPEIEELESQIRITMQQCMDITQTSLSELKNAKMRLEDVGFDDEIGILNNYVEILGKELELAEDRRLAIVGEEEWVSSAEDRSLEDHLRNLAGEITHDLRETKGAVVALSDFVSQAGDTAVLSDMVDVAIRDAIRPIDTLEVVNKRALRTLLEREELQTADLKDTDVAIDTGRQLAADFLITGSLVETSRSIIIFGRLIRIETGAIESVAQVVISKSEDVMEHLGER